MPTKRPAKPAPRAPVKTAPKARAPKKTAPTKSAASGDVLTAPMKGVESRVVGRVRVDVARAGAARVKRMIYPPGFRWSVDMRKIVKTDACAHAHVGFLARGEIHVAYGDGCVVAFKAPQVVVIDPGHDGWVVGHEPAVLIEFDFERETVARLGMPTSHQHA